MLEIYEQLTQEEQEKLQDVIRQLYRQTFLLERRDVHNAPSIKNYGFDEYISTYESPDPDPAITATNWIWSAKDSVKRWRRTEYFVNKSIDFVKRHKDQPFFLNLWPDDMHTPWVPEFKQKDNKSWNTEEAFIPVLAEMDKQIGRFIKASKALKILQISYPCPYYIRQGNCQSPNRIL